MDAKANPLQEIPKSEIIDQTIEWIYSIGAMRAALELQIWEKIADGEDTVEKMASHEGWDPIGTRVLLNMICTLKLLSREGERFSLVPESAYYLLPGKPTYKGGLPQNEFNWEGNGKLAESIRSGKRPIHYDATKSDVINLWIADYSRRWVYPENYFESDINIWESLDIQARNGLKVLDVACGPAPISMALARKHTGVQLTWLDWEGVLQTALKVAAKLEIVNQVVTLGGNLWSVDFGISSFDVVYLGNVTHFFSPEENTRLFQKVEKALVSGGTIVVHSVARRDKEGMASAALWLYAATNSGGAYDFNEYKTMLESASFTNVEDINLGPIKAVKN
jgi:cyclopropane fatty-acyl-phospholipid synthase-like methyltransferase